MIEKEISMVYPLYSIQIVRNKRLLNLIDIDMLNQITYLYVAIVV